MHWANEFLLPTHRSFCWWHRSQDLRKVRPLACRGRGEPDGAVRATTTSFGGRPRRSLVSAIRRDRTTGAHAHHAMRASCAMKVTVKDCGTVLQPATTSIGIRRYDVYVLNEDMFTIPFINISARTIAGRSPSRPTTCLNPWMPTPGPEYDPSMPDRKVRWLVLS